MKRIFSLLFGQRKSAGRDISARAATPAADSAGQPQNTPRMGYDLGIGVGETTAMRVATVYSCVKLLSEAVASLPVDVLRLSSGIFIEDRKNPLHYLLNVAPNRVDNAFDFWRGVICELLNEGNAYILPDFCGMMDDVESLTLLTRGSVMIHPSGEWYTINDTFNQIRETVPADEIIHIKNLPSMRDRLRGRSVLAYAADTIGIAAIGDRETRDRFASGGNVSGIVSNGKLTRGFGEYQDAQLNAAAIDIETELRSGRRIISLPSQVDFKQLSLSSADLQFLETRKFSVLDICRFFRVPPSFIFADTSSNYKSAENARLDFLTNALNPILRNIECELMRKLFTRSHSARRQIKFSRQDLYTCDLNSRIDYQLKTIQAGLYTVNEWRQAENRPPVPDGDKVLVSANLKPIDMLAEPPEPDEGKPGKTENNDIDD